MAKLQTVSAALVAPAAALTCIALGGCATDGALTRAQGTGAGAAIGAVLGNMVGRDGRSTAVGAAAGAAIGLAIGDQVAGRKAAYAQREDKLRAAAAQAQKAADEARAYKQQLEQDIAQLETARQGLVVQTMAATERRKQAQANEAKAKTLLAQTEQALTRVRTEISSQQAAIREEQQQAAQAHEPPRAEGLRLVSSGINDLQSQERALTRAQAQLQLIDRRRAY